MTFCCELSLAPIFKEDRLRSRANTVRSYNIHLSHAPCGLCALKARILEFGGLTPNRHHRRLGREGPRQGPLLARAAGQLTKMYIVCSFRHKFQLTFVSPSQPAFGNVRLNDPLSGEQEF